MSERLHVNLTATEVLLDALGRSARTLDASATRSATAVDAASLDRSGAHQVGVAATALADVVRSVHSFLGQVRSLDHASEYLLYRVAGHPAWADPGASLAAARDVAAAVADAFDFGLGDGSVDELIEVLAGHQGDPVFALELWRRIGSSATGMGAVLWAVSVAPGHQREQVAPLMQGLGTVLAVAQRAAFQHLTYEHVMADLRQAVDGDVAALAVAPLLFAATAVPFTASFLRPMWVEHVLVPNRERQVAGRALPASYVHDGRRQRDVRSLVLEAVARNPRASAELLAGADLHGTPNVHRLIGDELLDPMGPGILDGDAGRAFARVIAAATVPPFGPVGPWGQVSPAEQAAAAGAVVAGFGDRAHLLGWQLPDALRELAVRNLPTFQMPPPSFGAVRLDVPAEVAPVPGRERGLRFLSLLFTRRSSEDVVVAAAEEHVRAASARLDAEDHAGHLGLGLLWGALADASIAGRLVHAIRQDHARDEQRAAWEVTQLGISLLVGGLAARAAVPGGMRGASRRQTVQRIGRRQAASQEARLPFDETGRDLEEVLLPDRMLVEAAQEESLEIVDGRRRALRELVAAPPSSTGWAAALAGFEAAQGDEQRPPGYVEPDAAILVEVDTVLDGLSVPSPDLEEQREALEAADRLGDAAVRRAGGR
jgi:hypothetical protein